MPDTSVNTTDLLVVDPRPEDYQQLAATNLAANYHLDFVTSGESALRKALSAVFDLWLINFHLPDMTGAELLTTVRSRNPNAACILISDTYSATDELSARQLGATLYACKPLQAEWLAAIPDLRKPTLRDHSAHGPPQARASPPGRANLGMSPSTQEQSKS